MSRTKDYSGLRRANTTREAINWFQMNEPGMLNGNVLRAKIVQMAVEAAKCNVFVETGTSHAATAIGVNLFLQMPVWSCENSPVDYWISRAVTLGMQDIALYDLDSRDFLRLVTARVQEEKKMPVFYLDAHEGALDASSLPLAEELAILFSLEAFVVFIDDFRIPDDDRFIYGTYSGTSIDVKLIRDVSLAAGIRHCYFPAYRSSEETGFVTGFCLFWRSQELDARAQRRTFPSDLIRVFSLETNKYV